MQNNNYTCVFKKGKYLLDRAEKKNSFVFLRQHCNLTFCNKYIKAKNINK